MRSTTPRIRRVGGLVGGLVLTLATAGCAASTGPVADTNAATGQSTHTVATGNTLNQPVPAAAANAHLVKQDGRPLTLASLQGKTVVLAPLLTMCQETCPMTTANMHRAAQAVQRAGHGDQVVFLELTVDPQRDTVRRIHAYAGLYGALPDWQLATGQPGAVAAVWKALGVSTDKTKPEDTVRDWMTGKLVHHSYDVHHQDVVMIIDPSGHLRWITIGHPDARGTHLPTSLRKFLNDEGRQNYTRPHAGGASAWTARDVEQAVRYVRDLPSRG
jgi:protein SCO1/2